MLQPVFDAIVQSAVGLCNGLNRAAFLYDGELIHNVAGYNYTPESPASSTRHSRCDRVLA